MHLLASGTPQSSIVVALVATVMIAAWSDLREWRIPNALLAPSAAAALMLSTFAQGGQGITLSLIGAAAGLFIFLPLYLLKGMGAGDIKLMTVIGMYAGPDLTMDIALLSALIGGLWVIVLLNHEMSVEPFKGPIGFFLRHKLQSKETEGKNVNQQNKRLLIPYGVVIAVGTIIALGIASSH